MNRSNLSKKTQCILSAVCSNFFSKFHCVSKRNGAYIFMKNDNLAIGFNMDYETFE